MWCMYCIVICCRGLRFELHAPYDDSLVGWVEKRGRSILEDFQRLI